MINKIRIAKERTQRLFFMLLLVVTYFHHDIVECITHQPNTLGLDQKSFSILLLCLTILVFFSIHLLVEVFFDEIKLFRSIAMGKENIEGIWLDIVYKNGVPIGGGFLYIRYRNESYILDGVDYYTDGRYGGTFKTTSSLYKNRELNYIYTAQRAAGDFRPEEQKYLDDGCGGRGFYNFSGDRCLRFSGEFFEDHTENAFTVRGMRLGIFLIEPAFENLKKNLRKYIIRYHKGGWKGRVFRTFSKAPDLLPSEESNLVAAAIDYYLKTPTQQAD